MSYKDIWAYAEKEKTVVDVTPLWVEFDKEGKSIIGRLKGASEVSSSLGSGTYLQYLMDTDDGLIKFSLGAATDKELKTVLKEGCVYKITYLGQLRIKGGRRVNQFKVMATQPPDDVQVTDSDVPF